MVKESKMTFAEVLEDRGMKQQNYLVLVVPAESKKEISDVFRAMPENTMATTRYMLTGGNVQIDMHKAVVDQIEAGMNWILSELRKPEVFERLSSVFKEGADNQ